MLDLKRLLVAGVAAGVSLVVASTAFAQSPAKSADFSVRSETSTNAQGGKTLRWERKGRWGVSLDLDQRDERGTQLNDVQAGAYFRVTPSLRVGGAVALGEKEAPSYKKTEPQDSAPRVRLETAFKF